MTTVSLVGSTGSIGTQAVEVIRTDPDRYDVVAIGAARSVDVLAAQAAELHPQYVVVADESAAPDLKDRLPAGTELLVGAESLAHIARAADMPPINPSHVLLGLIWGMSRRVPIWLPKKRPPTS